MINTIKEELKDIEIQHKDLAEKKNAVFKLYDETFKQQQKLEEEIQKIQNAEEKLVEQKNKRLATIEILTQHEAAGGTE